MRIKTALSWACFWTGDRLGTAANWLIERSLNLQGNDIDGPWGRFVHDEYPDIEVRAPHAYVPEDWDDFPASTDVQFELFTSGGNDAR